MSEQDRYRHRIDTAFEQPYRECMAEQIQTIFGAKFSLQLYKAAVHRISRPLFPLRIPKERPFRILLHQPFRSRKSFVRQVHDPNLALSFRLILRKNPPRILDVHVPSFYLENLLRPASSIT